MPDQDYTFRISFPADLSGAQATQAAIGTITAQADKLAGSAAQAGAETGRFVDATGRLREASGRFVETGKTVEDVKKHLSDAEHEADHFASTLKAGISIDLGHRLVEAISEVPAKFREVIEEGVRFNAQMETLGVGLAGAFRAADPDKYLNFQAAQVAGTQALEAIRVKANELGLDFHSVAEGLSINLRGLEEGGVTDLQQQIDIVTTLNQAAASKGLDGTRAQRDIIDLLQGRANRTLFGQELGITDQDVKMAREAGKLYEFLSDRLSAYKEGGQAAANTFAAAEQRLKNETEQLYGEISKPVFEALKEALQEINDLLKDGQVGEELKGLGYDVAELVKDGATLLRWGIEAAPVLYRVAEGAGAISLALALLKLPDLVAMLGRKSLAWLENAAAIDKATASTKLNTAATEENNLVKETTPVAGVGGVGKGAAAAEEGTAAEAGAGGFLLGGTSTAFLGVSLAALAAGYELIKIWESAKNQQIDALHAQSETGSAAVVAAQKQIDAADNVTKKEQARLDLTKQIADLQAKIAANQPTQRMNAHTGRFVSSGGDEDQVLILTEQLRLARHELDTLDTNAGRHLQEKGDDKRGREALNRYHDTDEFKLEQAQLTGNQEDIDAYGFQIEVKKIKEKLMETLHLPDALAQSEAEARALANDLAKQRKKLDSELDHVDSAAEKTKDAAGIRQDLDAKLRELNAGLPAGGAQATATGELGAVADTIKGLPEGTQDEISQKEKLAELLKQIIALRNEEGQAKRREDAATEQKQREDKAVADQQKAHDDALAAERLEVEILKERASGNEAEARQLEKKRDLQKEITRLMQEGLTFQEAQSVAQDRVNLKDDAAYAKRDDAEARREEAARRREQRQDDHHRRGDRESFVVHGYHDPNQDASGGLHTGGLFTSGLSGGATPDRFAGRPDSAAEALAKAPSAADVLAGKSTAAPTQKPPFTPGTDAAKLMPTGYDLVQRLHTPSLDELHALLKATPSQPPTMDELHRQLIASPGTFLGTGVPPASVGFGPAAADLGPIAPPRVGAANTGTSGALTAAARDASSAGQSAAHETQEAAEALKSLAQSLKNITDTQREMQHEIQMINSRAADCS